MALAALSVGCADLPMGNPDGGRRDAGRDTGTGQDGAPTPVPPPAPPGLMCDVAATYVYAVDGDNQLLQFDPAARRFTLIGRLSCPTQAPGATPFSMGVSRDATAWILYSSGELFRVNTANAACSATSYRAGQMGFRLFGMGYSSSTAGGTDEQLHIAGDSRGPSGGGTPLLGTLNVSTMSVAQTSTTALPGWPELTGTGNAELWGFFPQGTPSVRQIDKRSGATTRSIPVTGLDARSTRAWAFAFWGGRFYVFVLAGSQTSTDVWQVDPRDNSATRILQNTGYTIVGAGVSTCAPIMIPG